MHPSMATPLTGRAGFQSKKCRLSYPLTKITAGCDSMPRYTGYTEFLPAAIIKCNQYTDCLRSLRISDSTSDSLENRVTYPLRDSALIFRGREWTLT